MKNKKTILSVLGGIVALGLVFFWLFFGSSIPKPTVKTPTKPIAPAIKNSVLSREENGKKIWEFSVEEAETTDNNTKVSLKNIKGKVYLKDGDVMEIEAPLGKAELKGNDFTLDGGVNAKLLKGGSLVAKTVTWKQKDDILTAIGNVKILKEDIMAKGDKAITTSKLEKLKLQGNALVEKGGKYDED